ncbi:MAG TPA: UDP-glucose 6-dehydrogenase [Paenibacillaceae bacterium]|nr:UDP-glucose 6-dehydrogenase [Paenibacillaceae bacterium]
MKVSVIGTGYVGLVTGTCLASLGHHVICADSCQEKIDGLIQGEIPFWEHGLEKLVEDGLSKGTLTFTTDLALAIRSSDLILLCVGTPSLYNGEANLSSLWSVISQVEKYSEGRKFLVVKSTVPIGIGDEIEYKLQQKEHAPYVIDVISNPEFLREGSGIHDFFNPDRIIIGSHSPESRNVMETLYDGIMAPLFYCQRKEAEMIKYASNSFLAMKISYINMIASLCEQVETDVTIVAEGMGSDSRIGSAFLQAGLGYGGSCFPKDLSAFWNQALDRGEEFPLLAATQWINQQQPIKVVEKIQNNLGYSLKGIKIALLGLTFKPMTDDIREAPSLSLSRLLLKEGADIQAYDPFVRDYPIKEVQLFPDLYEAVANCDVVVFVTEWPSFRHILWDEVAKQMKGNLLIDGRNIFPLNDMKNIVDIYGFIYDSIGRPLISRSSYED